LTLSPVEQRPIRPLPRRTLFSKSEPDPAFVPLDSVPAMSSRSAPEQENRSLETVDVVRTGSFFSTFEQAQAAVYSREARLGHIWRVGQTRRANDGSIRRVTLRCNHYGDPKPIHRDDIDPSDHRAGRTIRTSCSAHVNMVVVPGGGYHASVVDWAHNHPPQVPVGGHIPHAPTAGQRELVQEYASTGNFTRSHLSHILRARFPDSILEPRQISNLMNTARKEASDEYRALGGDIPSV
ncbi:hypothetical protein C8R46DRAFT_866195, partial [Mycena filopes]